MVSIPPPFQNNTEGFEHYKYTRTRLKDEVMYRREQQWKVFSWISSLLLAIIGFVIAFIQKDVPLANPHKYILTMSVFIFTFFGILRLRHDASVAKFYSDKCHELDKLFNFEIDTKSSKKWHLGHIGFLLVLAGITMGVVWFPVK